MSYLNQNLDGDTYCKVIKTDTDNYAVFMGSDPSLITCEKTSAQPGVYSTKNLDVQITDPNIVNLYKAWYNKNTSFSIDLEELVFEILRSKNTGLPLNGLPKMTKVLASTLSSIKELMIIYQAQNAFEFLCYGYRRPIADYLDQYCYNAHYLFPERFYTACLFETRFKNNMLLSYLPVYNTLVISNPEQDKCSLLMPVEWQQHIGFLEKGFIQ